jgi:N12 class adenine-specific DNA methylase
MGQKDGFLYHTGKQLLKIPKEEEGFNSKKVDKLWDRIKDKLRHITDEKDDIIEINGDKYIDQMMINMILIERIKQLEAKLSKTLN